MTDQEAFDQGVQEGMERIMQGKPAVEEKRWPDVFYATHEFEEIVRRYEVHDELLDALENWFDCADNHDIPCTCGRDGANAAIAKARKS